MWEVERNSLSQGDKITRPREYANIKKFGKNFLFRSLTRF